MANASQKVARQIDLLLVDDDEDLRAREIFERIISPIDAGQIEVGRRGTQRQRGMGGEFGADAELSDHGGNGQGQDGSHRMHATNTGHLSKQSMRRHFEFIHFDIDESIRVFHDQRPLGAPLTGTDIKIDIRISC